MYLDMVIILTNLYFWRMVFYDWHEDTPKILNEIWFGRLIFILHFFYNWPFFRLNLPALDLGIEIKRRLPGKKQTFTGTNSYVAFIFYLFFFLLPPVPKVIKNDRVDSNRTFKKIQLHKHYDSFNLLRVLTLFSQTFLICLFFSHSSVIPSGGIIRLYKWKCNDKFFTLYSFSWCWC